MPGREAGRPMLRAAEYSFQFFRFDTLRDASYISVNGGHGDQIINTQERFFYGFRPAIEV
jgi:hypothetical protein